MVAFSNIYTIPASVGFADALAQGVLRRYGGDPLSLSRVMILLPNRRSCLSLREAFQRQNIAKTFVLPRIQSIGDLEDLEYRVTTEEGWLDIPPAISAHKRQLLLTELIMDWGEKNVHNFTLSPEQAAYLAHDLAGFLDQMQRDHIPLSQLDKIVPEELSSHWQITLDFLDVVKTRWPEILEHMEMIDPITRRNCLIEAQAKHWQEHPPQHPVIAAGSTGSTPSTKQLLKTITTLPQGAIILPGLNTYVDNDSWDALEEYHPHYGLKQLLNDLGVRRDHVDIWEGEAVEAREQLMAEIMRPAEVCDIWRSLELPEDAVKGITRIDTAHLQEETEIISLMLRQQLETPGKTAALVTHSRELAQRVTCYLQKWKITIDDSAGIPMGQTLPLNYMKLVLEMIQSGFSAVSTLAVMKHPLTACGYSIGEFRRYTREFEMKILRQESSGRNDIHDWHDQLDSEELRTWLNSFVEAIEPLSILLSHNEEDIKLLLQTHISCAQALAKDDTQSGETRLWSGDQGNQVASYLLELLTAIDSNTVDTHYYAGILEALLLGGTYRPSYGTHPRLAILSPMEARLQHYDLVILGELNYGSWPAEHPNSWMNKSMQAELSLTSPEQQTGLSAHDFLSCLGAKQVVLMRAEKLDGTPTLPSQWLLRLNTVLKTTGLAEKLIPQEPWKEWARQLSQPDTCQLIEPPMPCPPLAARPKAFSVTQIEKWLRDPYAIYARYILGLKPLESLDQEPDNKLFGKVVHWVLEHFVQEFDPTRSYEQHREIFLQYTKEALQKKVYNSHTRQLWQIQIEAIARWFVPQEIDRHQTIGSIKTEIKGTMEIEGLRLEARVDRLEISRDGEITIIDYKTGTPPDKKDIVRGLSCQLSLAGCIAQSGNFPSLDKNLPVAALEYWKVSASASEKERIKDSEVTNIIDNAHEGLKQLITDFNQETTPYLACPDPGIAPKYNDYEHLERLQEWDN